MNHERPVLIICLLVLFFVVLNYNNEKTDALPLIVHDETESIRNRDFLLSDVDMNVLPNQDNLFRTRNEIANLTDNLKAINYNDIKSVKFFYGDNGTIIADVLINNNNSEYGFTDGTTYGMAININPFPNATEPRITDADYIYKYVYSKGTWYKALSIRHSGGEQKSFAPEKIESRNINLTEHFIRLEFDNSKIGKPDSFQVQFFAWTRPNLPTNLSYSFIDIIPWIEVPTPEISLSLDREINKVFPQDTKKLNLILKSTSTLSKIVKLCQNEFCESEPERKCDNYCWNFERNTTQLSPLENMVYIPVTLSTGNIDPEKLHAQMYAYISPADESKLSNSPVKILKVWDFDVGDHWSEAWENFKSIPSHILALIVSIITFVGGLFIDRKWLSTKVKNLLRKKKNL